MRYTITGIPAGKRSITMTTIKADHLITSVADALQFISCYHPLDFVDAVHNAWQREESPAAKDALAQILVNSRMCAEGRRPICQDTGIVTVFISIGMDVRWDDAGMSVADMVNEGVRRAYTHQDNVLRPPSWPTRPAPGKIPATTRRR